MAVRGVLLDFYGTVVHDDDEAVAAIVARVAASVNGAAAEVEVAWTRAWRDLCASCSGDDFRSQRELALDSLSTTLREQGSRLDAHELHAQQVALWASPDAYDDARAFLAELDDRGVPVCLVSDVDDGDLEAALGAAGLDVPLRVTSESVRAYKPDARPFVRALELLGLGPDEVVHVGDSLSNDVGGAAPLGIRTVWVDRWGRGPRAGVEPTWTVPHLAGLAAQLGDEA